MRRLYYLLTSTVVLITSVSITRVAVRACEKAQNGLLVKRVNPDVDKNELTISVTYTKKESGIGGAGKEVRFIEMIGPKKKKDGSKWPYRDRFMIGGAHKTIAKDKASDTKEWKITKNEIGDLRKGSITNCNSCHQDLPPFNADGTSTHEGRSNTCSNCHPRNQNDTAKKLLKDANLGDWGNPRPAGDPTPSGSGDFRAVSDADFKQWLKDMRDTGYKEYIDVANGTAFKTLNLETPAPAQQNVPQDFDIQPHNHWSDGWFYLDIVDSSVPGHWDFVTIPPLRERFFLLADGHLYGEAIVTPRAPLSEGDQGVATICSVREDTGECHETFTIRVVADTTAPSILSQQAFIKPGTLNHVHVQATAQDPAGGVAYGRIVYSLNGSPERMDSMRITSSGCDPTTLEYNIAGAVFGTNTLSYRLEVVDALGNLAATSTKVVALEVENIPALSEWGLVVMGLLVMSAATVVIMRRRAMVRGGV